MKSLVGQVVGGCQIIAELAAGGMGVVYRAKQLSLDRAVALKILSDRLAGDPKFVERFQREARAIARVNHPNILAVYDVGVDADLSLHYMIMELIDGQSLAEVLQEKGVLQARAAADYVRQAAMGLACAQSVAIIHRDIKPENIMVTQQNVVKVSDFGLAKEVDSGSLTATDSVMGTPAYMSPEQCDGKTVDGRTDIYSLGGTFYRLVTGRLPFEAETAMSMMYRHKHEPLTPPRQVVPSISRALSEAIVKMMAKRREDRHQTMEEVAKAITQALAAPDDGADTQETLKFRPAGLGEAGAPPPAGAKPAISPLDPRRRQLERLIVQGDKRLKHGDLPGAVRLWREAKGIADDPRIKERMEQHALPESEKNKKTAAERFVEGKFAEAERHYRAAVELNPDDDEAAKQLEDLRGKMAKRREAVNQVRQYLASNRLEEAVDVWDGLPEDFRDEAIGRQIRQVRDVVLPVVKLCEQGDVAMQEGDLERAVLLFRRGGDVDPQNERARDGLRDAERRLGRIEGMLKEGYQYNVKENYQRAIDAWSGVLKIIPRHPQATKLTIEARLRLGHGHRQKQGGRNQAISQWREILKLEPGHRAAQALLEEDTEIHERLVALSEEAQGAFSRKRYGRAISAWRRMLDLEPTNRKLETTIVEARKLRRKRAVTALAVILAVVAMVAAGGQFGREFITLRKADKLAKDPASPNPKGAATLIMTFEGPFVFLSGRKEQKLKTYMYEALMRKADRLTREGDFDAAGSALGQAKEFVPEGLKTILANRITSLPVASKMHSAELKEKTRDWATAAELYRQAAVLARRLKLDNMAQKAEMLMDFSRLVDDASIAERDGGRERAVGLWREAAGARPGHPLVKAAFDRLGISEE